MRIIQILDALDYGDGVCNSVINTSELLNEMEIENIIYSKWYNDKVEKYRKEIRNYHMKQSDIIIFHFSGHSDLLNMITEYDCTKIICYHNVTPPEYFKNINAEAYERCQKGIDQFKSMESKFDHIITDSEFNKKNLLELGIRKERIEVFPIVMGLDKNKKHVFSDTIINKYKNKQVLLSVGRIAPNKKIEDIITLFSFYYNFIDRNSFLLLVGNYNQDDYYYQKIRLIIQNLKCKDNVILTGKIDDIELASYYKIASYYICMSEHEGFCLPLIEAMNYEIPVLAWNSCAIPYTMGNSGILINEKKFPVIAKLINILDKDSELRDSIIQKQNLNIEKYKDESIKNRIRTLINEWQQMKPM